MALLFHFTINLMPVTYAGGFSIATLATRFHDEKLAKERVRRAMFARHRERGCPDAPALRLTPELSEARAAPLYSSGAELIPSPRVAR